MDLNLINAQLDDVGTSVSHMAADGVGEELLNVLISGMNINWLWQGPKQNDKIRQKGTSLGSQDDTVPRSSSMLNIEGFKSEIQALACFFNHF